MALLLLPLLSFVPMLGYALLFWWFDRYEKEPLHLLSFSFLWGALPAIILSLIFELLLEIPIVAFSTPGLATELLGAAIAAPIIEELAKALGLAALLVLFPLEIDGPLDGIIYGALAGFGFAAVENFFYFFAAYAEGGIGQLLVLAFLRAGLFGLNHGMYTAFTGLGLALAHEARKDHWKLIWPLLGVGLAIGAHALHNSFATFWGYVDGDGPLWLAVLFNWSGVLLIFIVAVGARIVEKRRIDEFVASPEGMRLIPAAHTALFTSTPRRWKLRLEALFKGDVARWWHLGRYFQRVAQAAFKWHRGRRGDVRAQGRYLQLREQIHLLQQIELSGIAGAS